MSYAPAVRRWPPKRTNWQHFSPTVCSTAPGVRRESAKLAAKIAGIDTALADLARRNPVIDLLADGPAELETRWAALSPDLKGKIVDELCTVVVNPSPKGRYFKPECIDIRWKA